MKLELLKPNEGSVRNNTKQGRGQGSGGSGTARRGHKGAKSRSGYSKKIGFNTISVGVTITSIGCNAASTLADGPLLFATANVLPS